MLLRFLQDRIFPPLCPICDDYVRVRDSFCTDCVRELPYLPSDHCKICAEPFDFAFGGERECGRCLIHPPRYDKAAALFAYESAVCGWVLKMKRGDRHDLTAGAGRMMHRKIAGFGVLFDYIAGVPAHYYRLFQRAGNPPDDIARALSKISAIPLLKNQLLRVKKGTQKGKTRTGRVRNLQGAFTTRDRPYDLRGKNILLIDDVFTTGATADSCAGALKKAGVKKVCMLTVARVVPQNSCR